MKVSGIWLLLLLQFATLPLLALNDTIQTKWVWVPNTKATGIFTADARAHRLSFERNLGENSYTASMGGFFPVASLYWKGKHFQMSASGATYITLVRRIQSGTVQNSDYFGDLILDGWIHPDWGFRIGMGHTSQHLSDDAITSGLPFKNYAKDYATVYACYRNKKLQTFAYAGGSYAYNFKTASNISGKWMLQAGFEQALWKMGSHQAFYLAGDIKFREELNFSFGSNLQAGYRFKRSSGRLLRLAVNRSDGIDERGYFQPANRNFFHGGIYLDL